MIRQNTAAIVVSDPAVLHTDLILLAAYPGIIMIITGDSDTNAIIAIVGALKAVWRTWHDNAHSCVLFIVWVRAASLAAWLC